MTLFGLPATRALALTMMALFAATTQAHSTLSDIIEDGEERVTLPVVPDSKLVIHATNGIDKSTAGGTVQSLPLAVFLTLMSPAEVEAWYRKQLPEFTVLKNDRGDQVQILQQVGDGTRVDGPDTYRIPNIRIRPTDARMATHMEDARTMLQVYYRPAPKAPPPEDGDS